MSPLIPSDRDWSEDASDENGNYLSHCSSCGLTFIGHKRRYICRKCQSEHDAWWAAMSPEERDRKKAENERATREMLKRLFEKSFETLDKDEIV